MTLEKKLNEYLYPEYAKECIDLSKKEIIEFIDSLDNETINKIRNSKSDAEVRRLLKAKFDK